MRSRRSRPRNRVPRRQAGSSAPPTRRRSRCSSSTARSPARCSRRSGSTTGPASPCPPPARQGSKRSFLVKLASNVPARDHPYSADEIAASVDYVAPSFEIVGCRLPGGFANGGLVLIADGAANVAFVEGGAGRRGLALARISRPRRSSSPSTAEEKARGAGSLLMWGDPLAGGGLARDPAARRRTRTARRGRGDDRHLRRHPADRPRRRSTGGLRGARGRRGIVRLTGARRSIGYPVMSRLLVPAPPGQREG